MNVANSKYTIIIGIIVLLSLGLFLGTKYLNNSSSSNQNENANPTSTVTYEQPTATPYPSPTPKLTGSTDMLVQKELAKFGKKTIGESNQTTTETLPQTLDGPPWVLIQEACKRGGYDLSPFQGKTVTIIRYPISRYSENPSLPNEAYVDIIGNQIICITETPNSSFPLTGGPNAINEE